MEYIAFNGLCYSVDPFLDGFSMRFKPSSNVAFYGVHPDGKLYVQFKNGVSYLYTGLDDKTISMMEEADSIGKFINARIVPAFSGMKRLEPGVKEVPPVVIKGEGGTYVGYFDHRPDVIANGGTAEELLQNLKHMINVVIENEEYMRQVTERAKRNVGNYRAEEIKKDSQ